MALSPKELIGALIAVVVGLSLYPVISDTVTDINETGTIGTLLDLIPLLYIIVIVAGVAGYVYMKAK